ncbi:hypothetical protein DXG03_006622 [Asterophora parasitica]|uniref:Oligopeptide transporter n=1 Tax=Asterophora parasitica TaxID=117018 RepID=A0A9P7G0W7_9AGAR|nr:hypothetical protein DXG03_006622 [Asterophora parasitica]
MPLTRWLRSHGSTAQPEFTLTAVLLGLAIGCLICFTNLSLGLQSGWISMMSIQSALIGFLVSRMLPTPLTPQEIIVVQTTAVATGTMPLAAGFVGILPALGLLSVERDGTPPIHLTWLSAVGWSCGVAFFGVFLSPPIRKQVIIEEELKFPSGTATAQLISVLHNLPPPNTNGIIMGFPTTVSMNLGMFVGWAILSPISKLSGWAPGPVGDMTNGARGWILWTSLGIMCADSFVSLLPVGFDYVAELITKRGKDHDGEDTSGSHEVETEDRLVPMSWVLSGLAISILVGTILVWVVFGHEGIKPWATILGFILGGMLSIFGVRALGETDLNPVSGLGKISQLVFAWVQPGNIVANIIAGGVTEAGAQQAGDLMQDLKTGHLLHASPRAQFYGQLIGSSVSILVTTTAFTLYNRAYVIPGPSFPAPTAYVWLSLARLLRA